MGTVARSIVILLFFLSFLNFLGCAARPSPVGPAKDQYMQAADYRVEGTKTRVQGAAIGAALGGIAGAVAGAGVGKEGAALLGGLIGTAVGSAAGLVYAEHVVRERQQFADASTYLQECTKALNAQIASAQAFNAALITEAAKEQQDRSTVEATIRDSKAVLKRMQHEIDLQKEAEVDAENEKVPNYVLADHKARMIALDAERRRLEAHIERLAQGSTQEPAQFR